MSFPIPEALEKNGKLTLPILKEIMGEDFEQMRGALLFEEFKDYCENTLHIPVQDPKYFKEFVLIRRHLCNKNYFKKNGTFTALCYADL
jgi:hypothetical protein